MRPDALRNASEADYRNLLKQKIEDVEQEHRDRTRAAHDVRVSGEQISAFSLHPVTSWPSPVPGRPKAGG